MKKHLFFTLLIAFLCITTGQAKSILFDLGWKFYEGDIPEAKAADFNDSKWKSVNLPHDWDIYHAPNTDAATGNDGGYFPGGIGWYRKEFKPDQKAGEKTVLHFEGVYQKAEVYVNGTLAATHAYGYTPFYADITSYVKQNQKNIVAVKVDNSLQHNCRWYSGSGIYRHVWLETHKDGAKDDATSAFVTTEKVFGISADGLKADSAKVRLTYDGKTLEVITLKDVKLWSPEQPYLYNIKVGDVNVKHGVRTFTYDAEKGFVLNGKSVIINGACVHHDDGILGSMAFDAAEARKVKLMKQAGFNLIRTAHNPTSTAFLNTCDSIGMLVIGEVFDGWYNSKTKYDYSTVIDSCYKEDIKAMIFRDRNHPSIISWSIGNEVMERKEIRVVQTARKFKAEILKYDTTRPVTEALCAWDKDWEIYDPHAEVLDIVGYNYMLFKHATDHQRDPKRVMWQTESYPRDAFKNWSIVYDNSYVIGDIVWTGLDYLGESGIGRYYYEGETPGEHYTRKQFPWHGAYCGDVDLTGWRKPISHYRSILWNNDEPVYMAVKEPSGYKGVIKETSWSVWPTWESWTWNGWEGKDITVEVYTKAPSASLYLNDKLIATKDVNRSTEYKAVFTLPYQPGTLKAVAGNASTTLKTAGEAYAIRMTPDKKVVKADGEDLAFIILEIIDKDGNIVPEAAVPVDIQISGAGTLLAAGSANLQDTEATTSSHVTTWKGRAMVVVRSTQQKGKINVTTKSKLKNANSLLQSRP